jgi:hypothetical protein
MVTGIVGKLIRTPEEKPVNIPGKKAVKFTVVENNKRGEGKVSVFYNMTMICGTDRQFDMVVGLQKGTVLMFSGVRVTGCKEGDKDQAEVSHNIYANVNNFDIIASTGEGDGGNGGGASSGGQRRATPSRPAQGNAMDDPFDSDEPGPFA